MAPLIRTALFTFIKRTVASLCMLWQELEYKKSLKLGGVLFTFANICISNEVQTGGTKADIISVKQPSPIRQSH